MPVFQMFWNILRLLIFGVNSEILLMLFVIFIYIYIIISLLFISVYHEFIIFGDFPKRVKICRAYTK